MQRAHCAFHILNETFLRVRELRRQESRQTHFQLDYRHQRMQAWADKLLSLLKVQVKAAGALPATPSIFVGNHTSYLDIPILMSQFPVVFVAKRELAQWPFFGAAMKSVGTIFVERESKSSRQSVAASIAPYILEKRQSVAIFPSGTTTLYEEKPWRWGAFTLARDYEIPIIPFRLSYRPLRAAAYLLEDSFPIHLWNLLGETSVVAEIEFHPAIMVTDPAQEAERWRNWTRSVQGQPSSDSQA